MDTPNTKLRLAVIAVAVALPAAFFAYSAGWLSPARLTPAKLVDQLQANGGNNMGERRNHTKGLCVSGYFEGNGQGTAVSSATAFTQGRYPVSGRFSLPGGNPHGNDAAATPRSLSLKIDGGAGQQWRMAMLSSPVFVLSQPQDFYQLLKLQQPDPATGKPDGAKIGAFFKAHPESAPFLNWAKNHKRSDSFASTPFNSLNAFAATNADGERRFVRWSFLPQAPFAAQPAGAGPDFLFTDLQKRLEEGPVSWQLQLQLANPGDPVTDATKAWPADRQHIDVGTLVLTQAEPGSSGACRDINFDPTILPAGLSPSADPLLPARSAVYSDDFTRRIGEQAKLEDKS
ncbi:catalase family peroxidase [Gallaecimonas xiamenensis]|uniref:Catalase-related peroxidase n=1 Tax=Gallaecimonas xiamenensis 3-C-1 TaxID=745411 RepID=K2K2C7_9GAMM|nr:catalase family peroxidase [Gallaecimonas xiamenensis]EKE71630.1 Catalase domain-containing protein [Gallaecimonas xiamenensis 3-C-1]